MPIDNAAISLTSREQLLSIIQAQTDIFRLRMNASQAITRLCELAQELTYAQGAVVEMIENDELVYTHATGSASAQIGQRLKLISSLSGICISTHSILMSQDTLNDPRVDQQACRKLNIRSMLVAPLEYDDEVIGVLKVYSPATDTFDEVDVQLLGLSASIIVIAINAMPEAINASFPII